MIKLHLFTGFENKKLGITPDMELGHLYEDTNSFAILVYAAGKVGMKPKWAQNADGFVHFDLWGRPLEKAKQLFHIASDLELAEDISRDI